jgi:hypothetical protein
MIGYGFGVRDNHVIAHGNAQPHLMDRHPGGDFAAIMIGKAIGFNIGDMPFNIPQAIGTPITGAGYFSGMYVFSRSGF